MELEDSDGQGAAQPFRVSNRFLHGDAVDMVLADEQYSGGQGFQLGSTTANATQGTTLWTLGDNVGSIRDVVDNNGIVRQHVLYNSFGARLSEIDRDATGAIIDSSSPAAIDTLFSYTGRDWDSDTGLQYNRARWYDPAQGRWLSQDPIGFAAGDVNLYRYVGNDPQNWTDPSGLHEEEPSTAQPHRYQVNIPWVDELGVVHSGPRPYDQTQSRYGEIGPPSEWHRFRDRCDYERDMARYNQQLYGQLSQAGEGLLAALGGMPRGSGTVRPIVAPRPPFNVPTGPVKPPVAPTIAGQGQSNPFKGKTPAEIDAMFKAKGFDLRGPDPLNGKGGYVDPRNGRSYHIDECNSFGEPPHVDINRLKSYKGPLDKKKLGM